MSVKIEWNAEAVTFSLRRDINRRLARCGRIVVAEARKLLSVPGTARSIVSRAQGGKARKRGVVTGVVRSLPGEPPRLQTGKLRKSVASEVDPVEMRVEIGTALAYGKHLEMGTKRGLAPRPWLRPALARSRARITKALGG